MAGDDKPPESPMSDPGGLHTPPLPALRLQHEGFYALLANGEITDPAEVDAMVASLQSLMSLTSPEEARLHLSQNRWSLQETFKVATVQSRLTSCTPEKALLLLSQHRWSLEDTVKSLFSDEATKHHVQADYLPRTLDAELECEKTTLATDTQTSPTTDSKYWQV